MSPFLPIADPVGFSYSRFVNERTIIFIPSENFLLFGKSCGTGPWL